MRRIASALMFAAMLAGCGRPMPSMVPVSGRVLYRGQPLAGGIIVFTPDAERGGHGPLACGEIDADGRYTLRTDGAPGAAVGWHVVTIAPFSASVGLPQKYRDPERSGQSVEVKLDQQGAYDLQLE